MAPKKPVDKAKAAAKAKSVEDKTFGLKNKNKSSKVQQYVQTLQKQQVAGPNPNKNAAATNKLKDAKKADEERQKELNSLFAVAIKQPKVPAGVDPKSIVCEFFRAGQCTKGAKCKFSHDLAVERKSAKIDLFSDQRELGKDDEKEGMEDWDQEQLEAAVRQKHENENANKATNIPCKFFLEAVESRLYGWFWRCPNGESCKYKHALPAGYVLKSQMKELIEEQARNQKDVAEMIEDERAKVDAKTPITNEVFLMWHRSRQEAKRDARDSEAADRRKKGILNGREIFMQEGFVAQDDDAAGGADDYAFETDAEVQIKQMMKEAQEAAQRARERAAQEPSEPSEDLEEENEGAGPSGSGEGPSGSGVATTLHLGADEAGLFQDDDDDEDLDDEDGDLDLDEGDEDEEDLDGLEAHVQGMHVKEDS